MRLFRLTYKLPFVRRSKLHNLACRGTWYLLPEVDDATRRSMKANQAKNTGPELLLRKALWARGIRGYRIHVKNLPGKPDLVFPSKRICVFVHGCFWHGCPTCKRNLTPTHNAEYWAEKRLKNAARDARNFEALRLDGYEVMVLWECEIKRSLHTCLARIGDALVP